MKAGEVFIVGVFWLGASAKKLSQLWDSLCAALQVWLWAPGIGNLYSQGLF